jgi:hypothetical protein
MATTIGLGVQFTANANGMTKGLAQAEQAMRQLARQAGDATKLFSTFASSSAAAAAAQQQIATDIAFLNSALKTGQVTADQYAAEMLAITQAAQAQAAAFAEGVAITEQQATAEEKRAAKLERLAQLLEQGAISEETFARASADASGANAAAAEAEEARAKALQRAAQITQANLTPQAKYDQEVLELKDHLDAGRISQETFNAALAKATASFVKAESAAKGYDKAADAAGDGGNLKFNELSGILAALPGPIGNVAGRLSGLSSAGEGLGRVFSGGISQGLSSIGTSVAGLVNPFTVGIAAVAGFGAAAAGVAGGLVELEDRVEKLGNLADQLGIEFEFMQVMEEAANRSGVSVETLAGSMTRLQKTLAGADEESKAAVSALDRLGISVGELNGLSQEDQIRLIGSRLSEIEDPAQRTAAAMALFGKSGAALLPFFKNLDPAASDLERFGKVLSALDRGRVDDFGAGLDALRVATKGLKTDLLLPFAGLGEGIAQGATEFIGGISAIVEPIGQVLEPALNIIGAAFEVLGATLGTVGRIIGAVFEPLGTIFSRIGISVDGFVDGITSVIRGFGDAAVAATEWLVSFSPIGVIADNIGVIGETISRLATIIGTAFTQAAQYVSGLASSFAEFIGLGGAIESIGTVINAVFGSVSSVFSTISEAVGGTVGRLLTIAENFLGIERTAQDAGEAVEQAVEFTPPEGFNDYEKAIQDSRAAINAAIAESAEFGQAGFDAALQFQTALEQLKAQADAGILNEEAYRQEIAKATDAYKSQIDTIKEAQKAEEEKIAAAERAAAAVIAADQKRADSFIESQGLGGEDPRVKAAEDLLAITRQIDEAETAIVDARAAGDRAAEQAALRRLAVLDQAQAAAQEVVEVGFSTNDANRAIEEVQASLDEAFTFDNFQIAPDAFNAAQAELQSLQQQLLDGSIDPETYRMAADELRAGFEDAVQEAEKLGELQLKYAEAAAEIDQERLDKLAKVSQEPLKIEDVRTSAGASEFLRLASGRQDPAVEEYRKQLTKLDEIKKEIAKVGGTVEIVGA